MGFVNEVASIEDIKKYNLPFQTDVPENARRWWTRDKERNMYLLGGGVETQHLVWIFIGNLNCLSMAKYLLSDHRYPNAQKRSKKYPIELHGVGLSVLKLTNHVHTI